MPAAEHMSIVLDHVFICTSVGAPAARKMVEFGLREGTPNRHPGQGTANRRFFFRNAMIELLWVEDAAEAQSEQARNLRLWERWSAAHDASPFGFFVRAGTRVPRPTASRVLSPGPESMPDL